MSSAPVLVRDQDLVHVLRQQRAEARHKLQLLQRHDELVRVARVRFAFALLGFVILGVALWLGGWR